jgi:hypothetical protein
MRLIRGETGRPHWLRPQMCRKWLWPMWFLLAVLIALIHLLTLTISPPIWQDEVVIVELGRTSLFEPHSGWSINWQPTDRPLRSIYYVGGGLQELAFRLGGLSPLGPRLASLLGGLAAATIVVMWLRTRGVSCLAALLLGLVFLLDPLFVQGYRGARVDCWAIALCVASCWLLRRAASQARQEYSSGGVVALAGGLAATAALIWPSAVFLYPLVAAEGVELSKNLKKALVLRFAVFAIVGAIGALIIWLIPVWPQSSTLLSDLSDHIRAANQDFSQTLPALPFSLLQGWWTSPFVPIIALVGVFKPSNRVLAIFAGLVFVSILVTAAYVHRLIYFLPYMIGLIGGCYQRLPTRNPQADYSRWAGRIGLSLLLVWAIGVSLIARPALALSQKDGRDPQLLLSAGRDWIGVGPQKVLLGSWEFYYAGRVLGWQMFRFAFHTDQYAFMELLAKVDYAIMPADINADLSDQLTASGLHYEATIDVQGGIVQSGNLPSVLPFGGKPYGPYVLYSR